MSELEPGPCRIVDVDGEPIRVQWAGDMTDADRDALAELARYIRGLSDEQWAELKARSAEGRKRHT